MKPINRASNKRFFQQKERQYKPMTHICVECKLNDTQACATCSRKTKNEVKHIDRFARCTEVI